jgi:quinol monooxygenase YgiN
MATRDTCCTIVPYFKVASGKMAPFRALREQFVARTQGEERCLYYGWSFDGDLVHCREGYRDADGLLAHLENVGALLQQLLQVSEIVRLRCTGRPRSWPSCAPRSLR